MKKRRESKALSNETISVYNTQTYSALKEATRNLANIELSSDLVVRVVEGRRVKRGRPGLRGHCGLADFVDLFFFLLGPVRKIKHFKRLMSESNVVMQICILQARQTRTEAFAEHFGKESKEETMSFKVVGPLRLLNKQILRVADLLVKTRLVQSCRCKSSNFKLKPR